MNWEAVKSDAMTEQWLKLGTWSLVSLTTLHTTAYESHAVVAAGRVSVLASDAALAGNPMAMFLQAMYLLVEPRGDSHRTFQSDFCTAANGGE